MRHKCGRNVSNVGFLLFFAEKAALGFVYRRFDRLAAGNSSRNFRAETEGGARYFVKFAPARVIDAVFSWHSALATPLVPAVAFGGRTGALDGHRCCAFEWCDGETSVDPERLTSAQIASLVEAYARLSAAMQAVAEPPSRVACAEEVDAGMPLCVIHGDLHYRNVFFRGDAVMHFLDFEKMRRGYPTEDLLRFFLHALERTRFWRLRRMDALVGNFAETVRRSPYPAAAWLAAIDIHEKYKSNLEDRVLKMGQEITTLEKRLDSPNYVTKAPKELVEETRRSLTEKKELLDKDPDLRKKVYKMRADSSLDEVRSLIEAHEFSEKNEGARPVSSPGYFPFMIDLSGKRVLVVGAGQAAKYKIRSLAEAGADLTVIAPSFLPEVEGYEDRVHFLRKAYKAGEASGFDIVVAATSDSTVNERVMYDAKKAGAITCSAEKPKTGDFIFPAVLRKKDYQVAISTDGVDPHAAKQLKQKIASGLSDELADMVEVKHAE